MRLVHVLRPVLVGACFLTLAVLVNLPAQYSTADQVLINKERIAELERRIDTINLELEKRQHGRERIDLVFFRLSRLEDHEATARWIFSAVISLLGALLIATYSHLLNVKKTVRGMLQGDYPPRNPHSHHPEGK